MFTKEERSSFPYWFAHWCAFQMTALNHHMWKPKYLFHDCEKPWLRLLFPYEKVQKWHRQYHNHHLEWLENAMKNSKGNIHKALDRFDWEAMMIDWECSRFTKEASPLTAFMEVKKWFGSKNKREAWKDKYPYIYVWWDLVNERCIEVLLKYDFE